MDRHDGTNARGPESGAIREAIDEQAIRGLLDHLGNRSGHGETVTLTLGRAFLRDVCVAALEAGESKRELEAVRRAIDMLALDVVGLESERDLRPDIAPEDVALSRWAAGRDSRKLSKVERAKVYAARRRIHAAMEEHAAKAGEVTP